MSIFKASLFIMLTVSVCGCDKEKLTKETESGEHTFSCKINGSIFKPETPGGLFSVEALSGRVSSNGSNGYYANIYALNTMSMPERAISLTIDNFVGIGTYELNSQTSFADFQQWYPSRFHSTRYGNAGYVIITKYDITNKILAGTFHFIAASQSDQSDLVSVTDGRFDIKLN